MLLSFKKRLYKWKSSDWVFKMSFKPCQPRPIKLLTFHSVGLRTNSSNHGVRYTTIIRFRKYRCWVTDVGFCSSGKCFSIQVLDACEFIVAEYNHNVKLAVWNGNASDNAQTKCIQRLFYITHAEILVFWICFHDKTQNRHRHLSDPHFENSKNPF